MVGFGGLLNDFQNSFFLVFSFFFEGFISFSEVFQSMGGLNCVVFNHFGAVQAGWLSGEFNGWNLLGDFGGLYWGILEGCIG